MSLEALLLTAEVADFARVKQRTVYRHVRSGLLPAIKLGSRLRFRRSDVDRWLEALALSAKCHATATTRRPSKRSGRHATA